MSPYLEHGVARGEIGCRAIPIDQAAPLLRIGCRNEFGNRRLVKCRIGIEAGSIFEREFFGFDEEVQMVGAAEAGAAQGRTLEKLQHLQCHDALAVGRQLPDIVAAISTLTGSTHSDRCSARSS